MVEVVLLDPSSPRWSSELELLGLMVDESHHAALFPYHFLYITLPKIGGCMALIARNNRRIGIGFLFPRPRQVHGQHQRAYTLRYHPVDVHASIEPAQLAAACSTAMDGAQVTFYDPTGPVSYYATQQEVAGIDIGRPSAEEAAALRSVQQEVWGSPQEFLYPSDIYSADFAAGTTLVARVDDNPAGFLFGFYKFGGSSLPADWTERFQGEFRLESQTMAVLPAYRGLRIAFLLKRTQAERAWEQGIGVINWTADPLQYPNAALNLGLLRAISFNFAPDLYPFRNELNRVHASRLELTWLVGTRHVRETPLIGPRSEVLDLRRRPQIRRVNDGVDRSDFDADDSLIAIEIPGNWTQLQRDDVEHATAWRTMTDALFGHYVGAEDGKYVITGVATDEERRYLVAERAGDTMWERLAQIA